MSALRLASHCGASDPATIPVTAASSPANCCGNASCKAGVAMKATHTPMPRDRKSTRLNSSHLVISYAVFCLKKKNNNHDHLVHLHNYVLVLRLLVHLLLPDVDLRR